MLLVPHGQVGSVRGQVQRELPRYRYLKDFGAERSPLSALARRLRWLTRAESSSAAVAYTFVSRVGILVLNFATSVLMARGLGPAGRGEAGAMALSPLILCGLMALGIPVALRYQVRRRPDDGDALYSTAVIIAVGLGFLAIAVGFFVIPIWLARYSADVIRFSQLMMLFAPQIMFAYVSQAYLEARGEFTRSNRLLYLPPFMTVVWLVVLLIVHAFTAKWVSIAYFGPPAIVTLGLAYRLRHSLRIPKHFGSTSRPLFHYGVRAYGLEVLGTVSGQVDQALVVHFLSATSFGLYGVGLNISRVLGVFATSFNTVLFPKASGLEKTEAIALIARSARLTLAVTSLAGGLFCLILPVIIPFVYGRDFVPVVLLIRIFTIDVILGATANVLWQAFMATGRPGLVTGLQATGLATALPLMLVLIPRMGLPGAAVALVISTILRLALVLACYPLVLHHRVPRLYLDARDVQELRANLRSSHQ